MGDAKVLRRRGPGFRLIAVGVTCVVAMAAAFAVLVASLDDRVDVVVVSRDVAAGQVLTSDDVTAVRVAADASLGLITVDAATGIAGKVTRYPLSSGTLLTQHMLASAVEYPAADRVVTVVAVRAGQVPAGTGPGQPVTLFLPGDGFHQQVRGVVVAVEPADSGIAITLDCSREDAARLVGIDLAGVVVVRDGLDHDHAADVADIEGEAD